MACSRQGVEPEAAGAVVDHGICADGGGRWLEPSRQPRAIRALAVGATGVSFRVQSVGGLVNNLCLLLRGTSGREWRYGLPVPAVGESIVVFAPLASVEGWGAADSPYMGDAGKFAEDLRSVAKLGIEVMRGGTLAAHGCLVDDFKLVGPTINGTANYAGEQKGNLICVVADDGAAPTAPTAVVAGKAGAYLIADAPAPGNYTLRAFMDVDGNGVMDPRRCCTNNCPTGTCT